MAVEKESLSLPGTSKPTWSIYDIHQNPEYQLAESLAMELNDIAGIEMYYYAKDPSITPDVLYGETMNAEYLSGKKTKGIYEVGEIPTVYSMFGMIATDQLVLHIPQGTWKRDIGSTALPAVGSAVVLPWYRGQNSPDYTSIGPSGRTFEIIHVAEDQNIFQLRSLVYSFYCIPYRFSEESQSAADISSDLSSTSPSITAYGDNEWIETQSDAIDSYDDVDTKIYGF